MALIVVRTTPTPAAQEIRGLAVQLETAEAVEQVRQPRASAKVAGAVVVVAARVHRVTEVAVALADLPQVVAAVAERLIQEPAGKEEQDQMANVGSSAIFERLEGVAISKLFLGQELGQLLGGPTLVVGDPNVAGITVKDGWFMIEGDGTKRRYINPGDVMAFLLEAAEDIE